MSLYCILSKKNKIVLFVFVVGVDSFVKNFQWNLFEWNYTLVWVDDFNNLHYITILHRILYRNCKIKTNITRFQGQTIQVKFSLLPILLWKNRILYIGLKKKIEQCIVIREKHSIRLSYLSILQFSSVLGQLSV